MFIVFDGIDGSGKTTQLDLCHRWLIETGRDVVRCVDPGSTALGQRIRDILLHRSEIELTATTEMLLFMAARAQLTEQIIRPALREDKIVLCDRYLLSTVVYQGHAGSVDVQSIWQIGRIATADTEPQLTIVFDLPLPSALRRLNAQPDRVESRGEVYLERVRRGFRAEAERNPERIAVVDAARPIVQIQHDVRQLVTSRLG